jgi:hypothetical protein
MAMGPSLKTNFFAEARTAAEAAHQLQLEIRRKISEDSEVNTSDWNIVTQIVLNQDGLAKKLHACGIIDSSSDLAAFGRAFARTGPLFSFVDIGIGKEQADHKIREMLRLMARVTQCKRIFFGPCHDNGYLPVLEPYKRDFASKITLIESTPAEPGFHQLGFEIVQFSNIFRSAKLPERPAGPPAITIPLRPATITAASATERNQTASYATVGKDSPDTKTIGIATSKRPVQRFYLVNKDGERLDTDLPKLDPANEKRFANRVSRQGRNFCNQHHLAGECANGDSCQYEHGDRLPPGELLVLRYKSRSLQCSNGSYCEDVTCSYGHHCKFGKRCEHDNCRFPDTHLTDMVRNSPLNTLASFCTPPTNPFRSVTQRPAHRVYEDGHTGPVLT